MRVLSLIVVLFLSATAVADDKPWAAGVTEAEQATAVKPWVVGVSEDEQKVALELYAQANVEFQGARFAQAVTKYKEALKHWDHPAIHFNLAVSLINLDQPLDAHEHLEQALKYGADPFGADLYAQGLTYRHSLDGQIARVKIACSEPGTSLTLDGAYLFTAPGEVERIVLPGKHQVVGTKQGYLTASETLELLPARLTKYDVHLVALRSAVKVVRRWAAWKPWAVLGSGGGALALGGAAYALANHDFHSYDTGIAAHCPHGCDATMVSALSDLTATKRHGELAQGVAVSLFAIGGAVAVAGAIAVVLNQPHSAVEHVPMLPAIAPTPGGATLMLGGSF